MLPISRYSTGVGAIVLLAMPIAQAQTVTTAALTATAASIPVDHPGALLLLVLAVCACGAWLARRTEWGKATLQAWAWSAGALVLVGVVGWSDVARAVLVDLQESFQQAGGETRSVPVQATGTALDGSPIGFMPVVYSNQSSGGLRIVGITAAPWTACFPMGLPASLPITQPHAGTRCSVGTALPPGSACWVDVAELCALGAADVRGSNPTHVAADSATVAQGASVSGNVLTNDSDADGMLQVTRFVFEGMTYAAGDQAAVAGRGTFTLASGGGYTFQAAPSFTGTNPLVVSYATQTGATSTLSLTVSVPAPINAEPIARDDTATVDENTSVTIAVRANDTDADGDSLVVTGVTQGANGSVVIDAVTGNPIYTPNAGFVGSDTFTYTVTDGRGGISTATVTVTVNPTSGVNHPPVAVDDAFSTAKDVALEIVLANLTANDTDIDGDTLAVFSAGSVVNGSLGYIQGKLHFTPSAGYVGPASFRYSIHDGRGGTSTATVNITVY